MKGNDAGGTGRPGRDALPACLMGAVTGDIAGSRFEWGRPWEPGEPVFGEDSRFTDDTVMTLAVARALTSRRRDGDLYGELERQMQVLGRRYPQAGYGRRFALWLAQEVPQPYGSRGNGAVMRCSPAGWAARDLAGAQRLGELTARPTHDHPRGLWGAATVAGLVFLARQGMRTAELEAYAQDRGCRVPRDAAAAAEPARSLDCGDTLAAALWAFFAGEGFDGCLRNALTLGGDSDTVAAVAGALAEARYGVPDAWKRQALRRLPGELRQILYEFQACFLSPDGERPPREP